VVELILSVPVFIDFKAAIGACCAGEIKVVNALCAGGHGWGSGLAGRGIPWVFASFRMALSRSTIAAKKARACVSEQS
jgi:hypothetical protein